MTRILSSLLLISGVLAASVLFGATSKERGDTFAGLARGADSRGPLPVFRAGKWGYIDQFGHTVIEPRFDDAMYFYEGLAAVSVNQLWGYINLSGELVIPFRFSSADRFSDELAWVRWGVLGVHGVDAGYIDHAGRMVVRCDGTDPAVALTSRCSHPFKDGFVPQEVELFRCDDQPDNPKRYPCSGKFVDSWGFYDKSGKLAIPGPFHSGVGGFSEGLAAVMPYGEHAIGFVDGAGAFAIAPRFERAVEFSEGLAPVRVQGQWGVVDRSGTMVITPKYEALSAFSQGLAAARLDGKWGYVERSGRVVIAPRFEEAGNFSEGLAAVCCDGGRTRYIDQEGRWAFQTAITRRVVNAGLFIEGIARADLQGIGQAYINRSGQVVALLGADDARQQALPEH